MHSALLPRLALSILLAAASLAGCASHEGAAAPQAQGEERAVLATREWLTEAGARVAILDYRGAPFVVTAVETSCVSRCPMTVEKLKNVDALLRRNGVAANVILVSLDPRTDTPATLARFKASRHLPQHWHLLSGSEDDTRAFAKYLDVKVAEDQGPLDHDVRIALFDASGRQTMTFHGSSFDPDEAMHEAR